jgi:hypothetical protein
MKELIYSTGNPFTGNTPVTSVTDWSTPQLAENSNISTLFTVILKQSVASKVFFYTLRLSVFPTSGMRTNPKTFFVRTQISDPIPSQSIIDFAHCQCFSSARWCYPPMYGQTARYIPPTRIIAPFVILYSTWWWRRHLLTDLARRYRMTFAVY